MQYPTRNGPQGKSKRETRPPQVGSGNAAFFQKWKGNYFLAFSIWKPPRFFDYLRWAPNTPHPSLLETRFVGFPYTETAVF